MLEEAANQAPAAAKADLQPPAGSPGDGPAARPDARAPDARAPDARATPDVTAAPFASGGYFMPFAIIQSWLGRYPVSRTRLLEISYDDFLDIIRHLLVAIPVDEEWYLAANPGVAARMTAGDFMTPTQHFVLHGYFEGRRPFETESAARRLPLPFAQVKATLKMVPIRAALRVHIAHDAILQLVGRLLDAIPVDEAWYRTRYPGVADAIDRGVFASAKHHFVKHGYQEVRWPFDIPVDEAWYLARYPDVKAEIHPGGYASARDHFTRTGYAQGRLPAPLWFAALWDRKFIG
jgi:hypothetical protein